MLKIDSNLELLGLIENLRNEMICVGLKEGLTSKKTIEISQKLDHYIAKYQANRLRLESKYSANHRRIYSKKALEKQ